MLDNKGTAAAKLVLSQKEIKGRGGYPKARGVLQAKNHSVPWGAALADLPGQWTVAATPIKPPISDLTNVARSGSVAD